MRIHQSVGCFLLLVTAAFAAAPANVWTPCGWGGGGFYFCAVFHPTRDGVLYLGGDVNGVYKSEDHGRNWRIINSGLANYGVYSLAVDRTHPETVFASTQDGLCKSTDGGEHWRLLPRTGKQELRLTGERRKSIRVVAVDPRDGNIVFAASPAGKIFKSTDGGETWALAWEKAGAPEEADAVRMQFGKLNEQWFGGLWMPVAWPKDAAKAECVGIGLTLKGGGTAPQDCFLTLKLANGVSYRSRNLRGLFEVREWRDVVLRGEDFAVDPEYAKQHPELAKALPATPDWTLVQRLDVGCVNPPGEAAVGFCKRFFFAAAAPAQHRTICDAARLKQVTTYSNIKLGAAPQGTIYSVAVSAKKAGLVAAATETAGAILSEDTGATWRSLATPAKVASVAMAASDANVMYAGCFKEGVWKSTDQGRTWKAASPTLAKGCEILEVAVSPTEPRDVYAIGTVDWNGNFYASHDGGATWTESSQLNTDREGDPTVLQGGDSARTKVSAPTNLAMSPRNPRELFMSANWRPCWSDDGGRTWSERVRGADISCVYDVRFHGGRTYVAAMDEGAFYSADNGASWRQIAPGKYDPSLNGHCWRVAITQVAGAERVIATFSPWWNKYPGRVMVSEDGGKSYQVATNGLPDYVPTANTMWGLAHARALAVDPRNPQVVYLGMDGDAGGGKMGGGIFKSMNGGRTWNQMPHQPGSRRVFFGLAIDPTNPQRLYWGASGTGGGLYRSEDGGESWQHVFKNETWIFNVLVTADGTVYCPGRNLWRSTDHGKSWKQLTRLQGDGVIVGLESDPGNPQRLWHSVTYWNDSAKGGVFRSEDSGGTWQEITGNLPYLKPLVLRFNPATRELWAGGVGLYRLKQ